MTYTIELTWDECFAIENALAIATCHTTGKGRDWYDETYASFRKKFYAAEEESKK